MNTVYKTDFRVGHNLINLTRKKDGYEVTNRAGKAIGFIDKTWGWCFYGYNDDEVSSQFAYKVSKAFPFGNQWFGFLEVYVGA